jgi:hypothetical protein
VIVAVVGRQRALLRFTGTAGCPLESFLQRLHRSQPCSHRIVVGLGSVRRVQQLPEQRRNGSGERLRWRDDAGLKGIKRSAQLEDREPSELDWTVPGECRHEHSWSADARSDERALGSVFDDAQLHERVVRLRSAVHRMPVRLECGVLI